MPSVGKYPLSVLQLLGFSLSLIAIQKRKSQPANEIMTNHKA
jgi:hypothetical protein